MMPACQSTHSHSLHVSRPNIALRIRCKVFKISANQFSRVNKGRSEDRNVINQRYTGTWIENWTKAGMRNMHLRLIQSLILYGTEAVFASRVLKNWKGPQDLVRLLSETPTAS